jgi:hypothetical protein
MYWDAEPDGQGGWNVTYYALGCQTKVSCPALSVCGEYVTHTFGGFTYTNCQCVPGL